MTNAELQQLTEQWSKEYFGREFTHKVFFNKRLKTTGGRYHLSDHHIDINPLMYTEFDLHNLRQVVLHELCHYHLHLLGMDYHHRSREFKTLLAQVGGSRYAPPTSKRKINSKKKWYYICAGCSVEFARQRRFNTQRYICRRCGHKFILKN
ncbi:SprT family protein [Limosilactobacillus reuteri]|uniref:SprT family protein n=1 Tax=Limosilactobacillus reuteri TaxID=1598 RepID=UPI002362F8F7|nr:SprT family protein [Limosilactobacillus reuteri]MDD1381002.1 SprT family protein [Limosilactobacillus reuteri]